MVMMRYVLFRENPNTHQEQYIRAVDKDGPEVVDSPEDAKGFDCAADAYRYGAWFSPALDWWRVGLR